MLRKLLKSDIPAIYSLLAAGKREDSNYSAVTLFAWGSVMDVRGEFGDGFLIVCFDEGSGEKFISPLASSPEAYMRALERLHSLGVDALCRVTGEEAELLRSLGWQVTEDRDNSEYLYLPEDLIELSGKRYHSKRNFINGFGTDYVYRPYEPKDAASVCKLMEKWSFHQIGSGVDFKCDSDWKFTGTPTDLQTIDAERLAVRVALDNMEEFGVFADVLEINGEIAGFALGDILPSGIGTIYFEKADITYKGIYPVLDNRFCAAHFSEGVRYINKQEDMGLEGLRKSKESFYPVKMADMYNAVKNL